MEVELLLPTSWSVRLSAVLMFACSPANTLRKSREWCWWIQRTKTKRVTNRGATIAPVDRLPSPIRSLLCASVPLAARAGLVRFLLHRSGPRRDAPPGFTVDQATTLHGLELQTKSFVAAAGCKAFKKSAAQAHAVGNLGDRPLIVLTAGRAFTVGEPEEGKELAAFHEIWVHQLQAQLARLSTHGRQVIMENSGGWEVPEAVVQAV